MPTWRELSEDSLLAAETLLQEGRYRSCISGAYYNERDSSISDSRTSDECRPQISCG